MDINHPHHPAYVRIGIIGTAILLTVAFHYLVAGRWFGLGLAIFAIFLVIGVHVIDVLAVKPNNTWAYVFLVPLLASAAAESMYASSVVRGLAFPTMILSVALFAYWFSAPRVGFWEAPVLWPATMIAETIWPYRGVGGITAGMTKTDRVRRVVFGLLIAAPVVVVVGILFAQADAVFGKVVTGFFDFKNAAVNIYRIVRDLVVAFFLIASGWTIYTRVAQGRKARVGAMANAGDKTIITTFLVALNALFLVFIAFQAAAFFGGEKFVQSQGISYANYAREGFFQLLAVAGIVFVIMIAVYRYTHLREWGSRALGMALIVETGVIIVSAVRRLMLYIDTYGLTLSRYWAMVVIIIIGVVLAALLVGALVKIKYESMIRAVFVGFLVLAPLLLMFNVNDYIVRFNFDRFVSGKTDLFDVAYLGSFGRSDAVPALVAALRADWPASAKVNGFAKSSIYSSLNYQMEELQKSVETDWRNAVISDYRALASLGALKDIDPSALVPEKFVGNFDASRTYLGAIGRSGYLFPKVIDGDLTVSPATIKLTKLFPTSVTGNVLVTGADQTFTLPIDNIGGTLTISNGLIKEFGPLPKHIGKDLDIQGAGVYAMLPAGIEIGGNIIVSSFTGNADGKGFLGDFIVDALKKGYKVLNVSDYSSKSGFYPGPCGSDENPCPILPAPSR